MASSVSNSSRQLDFYEAMADFEVMFPTLEEEIIEAVLRANNGQVDSTIDQLLTMTMEEGGKPANQHHHHHHQHQQQRPPPSGDENSSWQMNTSHISHEIHNKQSTGAICNDIVPTPDPWTKTSNQTASTAASLGQGRTCHDITDVWGNSTEHNTTYQNCVTPRIPKELLELMPSSDEDDDQFTYGQQMGHYPLQHKTSEIDFLPEPPVVPVRSKQSKHETPAETIQRLLRNPKWHASWLGPLPSTFLRIEDSGILRAPTFLAETSSKKKSKSKTCEAPSSKCNTSASCSSSSFSTELFKEDERIAIMLQNDEFINELQADKTFMNLLDRDHMNATAFEQQLHNSAERPDNEMTGYGDHDINNELPVFPMSLNIDGTPITNHHHHHGRYDEFRRRLKHMSKTSKQRCTDLAKLFVRSKRPNNSSTLSTPLQPDNTVKSNSRFDKYKNYNIIARAEGYNLLNDDQ